MNEEEKIKGYRRKTDQLITDKYGTNSVELTTAKNARATLEKYYSKGWTVDGYTKIVKYLEIILRTMAIASRSADQLALDAHNQASQKQLDSLDISIDEWLHGNKLWEGDINSFRKTHATRSKWLAQDLQEVEEPGSSMSNTARRAARGAARGAAVARAAAGKLWRKMTPQHAEPPQPDDDPSEWGGGSKRRRPKRTKRRPSRSRPKLSKKKKTKKSKKKRKKTRRRRR